MKYLLKASEERSEFYELIGKEITFAIDIIGINGNVLYQKGERAFISDVEYTSGYWSSLCSDIYVGPQVLMLKINGIPSGSWRPETFVEFNKHFNP